MTLVTRLLVVGGGIVGCWARSAHDYTGVQEDLKWSVGDSRPEGMYVGDALSDAEANGTGDFNVGPDRSVGACEDIHRQNEEGATSELEEGRHHKRRRMLLRTVMWLKALGVGVVLPSVVGMTLFAAWKAVTISLLALLLAAVVGLKGLVASVSRSSSWSGPHHVEVSGLPSSHRHYWKRDDVTGDWTDSHQIAYRAYT